MKNKIVVSMGDRYGKWTIIEERDPHIVGESIHRYILCHCDCGREKEVNLYHLRSGMSKQCRSCARTGENASNWKGSRHKTMDGYIRVICRSHPRANIKGKILEHILVMEKFLGRYISRDETVHHKNGVRDDNRIENLELRAGNHGSGSAIEDKIAYAKEILMLYEPSSLSDSVRESLLYIGLHNV